MSLLEIRTLGSLTVLRDGAPVTGFDSRKVSALLVYLACHPRPHARDALAEMLWENRTQSQSLSNLRVALTSLRQTVGTHVTITRDTVQMIPDGGWWLDAAEFDAHGEALDASQLEALLDLYRGDFLEGFYIDSEAFEDWIRLERERLRFLAVDTLDRLIGFDLGQADYAAGISHATHLLQIDPLREATHRQIMELFVRSGKRAAALSQYETCRQMLEDELGVEPSAQTVALYERIRSGEWPQPVNGKSSETPLRVPSSPERPPPPHNLPAQPTSFIGREDGIAAIMELLQTPGCRLVTLVGMGGIGKTRLALAVAERLLEAFEHGVFFVPLAPLDAEDDLVPALRRALDLEFHGSDTTEVQQMLDYLRDKTMLLVLDNFEHLLAEAAFVGEILTTAPDIQILVTSREPLRLSAEWRYPVSGMRVPEGDSTDLDGYETVQLFVARARQVRYDFALDPNRNAVIRLCRLVEGMPLGIELAAAWLDTLSAEEVADEIARSLDILNTNARDREERHRSLRAVLEPAWARLTDAEQDVFMRLSVFWGGFTREAAEHVAGATLPILASLVGKSLLRRDDTGRYTIHELLRQYAAEQLERAAETAHVRQRHAEYFTTLVEQKTPPSYGPGPLPPETLDELDREYDNLRGAMNWALAHDDGALAIRLIGAAGVFLVTRAHAVEGLHWAEHALENRQAATPQAVARAWFTASDLATKQGFFVKGRDYAAAALELARASGDMRMAGVTLGQLGYCVLNLGDAEWAQSSLEEARALLEEAGEEFQMLVVVNSLGEVARVRGNLEQAAQYYEEALVKALALGIRPAMMAINLGNVCLQMGHETRAKALFKQALEHALENGTPFHLAIAVLSAGNLMIVAGHIKLALRLQGACHAYLRKIGYALEEIDLPQGENVVAAILNQLDPATIDVGRADGRALALEEAVSIATSFLAGAPDYSPQA